MWRLSLIHILDEVQKEKIWLNSGGFIVIQQTEAFVSIDVNSGKFTGKKKAEESYRKINLEAAKAVSYTHLLHASQFVAEHGDQVCPAKWQPGAETLKPSLDLVGML